MVLPPVAVVGIAAELPSGEYSKDNLDYHTFFQFLIDEGQAYGKVPSDRFNAESWKGRGPATILTDIGAFLKDISLFDPSEFGVTPKETRAMSPSTRKLIELSFLALLDSGIHYRGQQVGCYMAGVGTDILTVGDPDEFEAPGSFAGTPCMIANKVSYHLDLLGPSLPIDTACSSSLAALHLAVQGLRAGDCKAALVGGCQLDLRFIDFIQYSQAGILAADGKCKPFDASADGFGRGEGAVTMVLKLLEDAVRDGDHIYATVLGTALTSNGLAAPIYAPVAETQARAMEMAYAGIDRNPKDVDFVELHATGTAVGDPTEANWVGSKFHRDDPLLLGSVKGNIGHLEITAFLASLTKVCHMFRTGIVPPNANLHTPNPAIRWKEFNMEAPATKTRLPLHQESGRHLVSMTSSGIGGLNGHAVIESPPVPAKERTLRTDTKLPTLVVAAGLSPRSSLAVSSSILESASDSQTDLLHLSTLFGRRARQMNWRSFALIAPDHSVISAFDQPVFSSRTSRPIAFVFSGQGTQYFEMGKQLFRDVPSFRSSILKLDLIYQSMAGESLIEATGCFSNELTAPPPSSNWPIVTTIPVLCMIQMALCDTLKDLGVVPDILVGHSAGEVALLYASGAATAEMTIELAIARGHALAVAEAAGGSMAALNCSVDQAQDIIQQVIAGSPTEALEIGCYNSAESVTISGHITAIDRLVTLAQGKGLFCRKLRSRLAVHSALMDTCRDAYAELIGDVFRKHSVLKSKKHFYSSYTGRLYEDEFSAQYFWDQTRHPVRFAEAMSQLFEDNPTAIFLEIGPHPALSSYINAVCNNPSSVLCPMKRPKTPSDDHEIRMYLDCIGRLVVLGCNSVDFTALNGNKFVPHLPGVAPYPFAKKHCPYTPEYSPILMRAHAERNGPLNFPYLRINTSTHPTIAQHVIRDEPIMPAAGFLEMAFEFGATFLWNVKFRSMMSIPTDKVLNVDVSSDGCYWSVKSRFSPASALRLHADGYMSKELMPTPPNLDIASIKARCQPSSAQRFHTALEFFATYGPLFRRVTAYWKGNDEALVQVRGAGDDLPDSADYIFHPAILDACVHVIVHPSSTANADRNTYYLPASVGSVTSHLTGKGMLPETLFAHAVFRSWRPEGLVFDVDICADDGSLLCTIKGLEVAAHQMLPDAPVQTRLDMVYQPYSLESINDLEHSKSSAHPVCFGNPECHGCTVPKSQDIVTLFEQFYYYALARKRVVRVLDYMRDPQLSHQLRQITLRDNLEGEGYCAYDLMVSLDQVDKIPDSTAYTNILPIVSSTSPLEHQQPVYDIIVGQPCTQSVFAALIPGGLCILRTPQDLFAVAQRHPAQIQPNAPIKERRTITLQFSSSKVLELQSTVNALQDGDELWLHASDDINGAAATGVVRCLRKEIPNKVHLTLFAEKWSPEQRIGIIEQLFRLKTLENDLLIDEDAQILVHRIVPISDPPNNLVSQSEYWSKTEDGIQYLCPPSVEAGNVLVRIELMRDIGYGVFAVFGEVVDHSQTSWSPGQQVVGLSISGLSNFCIGPEGHFTTVPAESSPSNFVETIASFLTLFFAVGSTTNLGQRLRRHRILVTDSDSVVGNGIIGILSAAGLTVTQLSSSISPLDFSAVSSCDLVLSGFEGENAQVLRSLLNENAKLFFWTDLRGGLLRNFWAVSDCAASIREIPAATGNPTTPESIIPKDVLEIHNDLFDGTKAYLLVGGIGSLGLHAALWMYKKGARKIILTSRSGRDSLINHNNTIALRTLAYLEGLPDLDIQLKACDASSSSATAKLLSEVGAPISGILLLSVQLSDQLFASHTESSWQKPFVGKEGAFFALRDNGVELEKLDFLVSISSAAIIGNAGQTNYASANCVLDELLRPLPNAFSLVAPAIIDSSTIARTDDLLAGAKFAHWMSWAMSSKEICACLEDGLRLLEQGPFWLYVPDLKWTEVQTHRGLSPMYDHLVTRPYEGVGIQQKDNTDSLEALVLKFVDVAPDEYDHSVPFTAYGLDSLSAGRLSAALKPFVALTQLQLLSEMCYDDVVRKIAGTEVSE